jgi:multicomponent Na+:H+ antiporter subunit F
MNVLASAVALFLLLNIATGLVRVLRGPTRADQMLVAQLLGTTGVAILLLLAEVLRVPALRDVALVLALLAATATVVFVRLVWVPPVPDIGTADAFSGERLGKGNGAGADPPD